MTDEFLELLWVLEATLAMEPELAATLESVVNGPCFKDSELPKPTDEERKPPKESDDDDTSDQLSLLGQEEEDAEEVEQ